MKGSKGKPADLAILLGSPKDSEDEDDAESDEYGDDDAQALADLLDDALNPDLSPEERADAFREAVASCR